MAEGSQRIANRPDDPTGPRVERDGQVWRIRSFQVARQVLRARNLTSQAGFTAEYIPTGFLRHHPILISDGPQHDQQRSKVARFFAPRVVADRYAESMARSADRLLAEADRRGGAMLDELALEFTVEVTAQVVGLTESGVPAMARRLAAFFNQPPFDLTRADLGRTPTQWARAAAAGLWPVLRFWWHDVRPAVRERRRRRRGDVISHLIEEDYTDADILVECVTYGTAGMVTTRELICMAARHLLRDDALRDRYLTADQPERLAVLNEVIRLEPVVGHLYRRATGPIELSEGDLSWHTDSGDLLDICIRDTNTDPAQVGEGGLELCPERELPRGMDPSGLAFGDGAHRCPGQPLALLETDALLSRLLRRPVRIGSEPELGWDDLIAGYRLRGFRLNWATAAGAGQSGPER